MGSVKRMRPLAAAMVAAAGVATGAATVLGTGGAGAQSADPPGDNGTVKVDGTPFDDHPDNQPHVGCEFEVDFYGFDQGDLDATVTFEAVAPTAGGELLTDELPIGEDPAGGGTDLDAHRAYDLTAALDAIAPHPEQGWHVKLTVHAEGSQGADTKYKVFWVEGCEPNPPEPSTTVPGSTPTTTPHSSTTTSTPSGHQEPAGPGTTPPAPAAPVVARPDYAG
jgi:hypothetical protein